MTKINKLNIDFNSKPLNDYPRPLLKRDSYFSLNGDWEIALTKDLNNVTFDKHCLVPYAVESPLSGVNHLLDADEYIIYKKHVVLPFNFKKKHLILHFEGVDQSCVVYINEQEVGRHIGGYTKFSFDIAKFVTTNEFDIKVVVEDKSDASFHSIGKQRLNRGGIFYTTTSGIYKPVWLESLDENYVKDVFYKVLYDEKCIILKILTTASSIAKVKIDNQELIVNTNQETLIKLENFHPWSLVKPYLYKVNITFFDDIVESYFALRKIEIKKASDGYKRFYLNNEPCFLKGVLDQGYYFLGNLTPRSYDDYYREILILKELGYNTIRKHIKTEIDLFYYYCDKLGMLVIQDFINGGEKVSKKATFLPGLFPNYKGKKDNKCYKVYGRNNLEGRKEFLHESKIIQYELFNHPSIIAYTIFNEGWGQFDSVENYKVFKNHDSTRFYDTTSGWVDFGASDFNSIHNYFYKNKIHKDRFNLDRPQFLSEYGGYGLYLDNHFYGKKPFGYRRYKTINELTEHFEKLHKNEVIPLIKKGLMGTIYTQVSDVEDEVNGIFTFDRKILKIKKEKIIEINKEIDEIYKGIK